MIEHIDYLASWSRVKLNERFGQRGAEMVEYAIVLACVAILGAWFYGADNPSHNPNDASKQKTFLNILARFWTFISGKLSTL